MFSSMEMFPKKKKSAKRVPVAILIAYKQQHEWY